MVENIRKLVRPVISIALTCILGYLFYIGKLEAKEIIPIFATVIGFHFGERSQQKGNEK